MTLQKQPLAIPTNPDLLIIGGGIVGLWCARLAAARGLQAVLIDKQTIGNGASGGFLGALMPHQPIRWTPEKAFQLDALMSLETEIRQLENETGLDCGYLRCGRIIPTRTEKKQKERTRWQQAAAENWPSHSPGGTPLQWNILEPAQLDDWVSPTQARLGAEVETLSARIAPRQLLAALARSIDSQVCIVENETADLTAIGRDPAPAIVLSNGVSLTPDSIILSAGHDTFALLHAITGRRLGRGVKGQAALMRPRKSIDPSQPIVYFGGIYVIAHDSGLIAIGSTSEKTFESPDTTTSDLDDLIAAATRLCPALTGAETVERWAGVRPNAVGRHPIIGPLPEAPRVVVATGGFKISFGIAHRMAAAALDFAEGRTPAMPASFAVASHYAASEQERTSGAYGLIRPDRPTTRK